MSISLTRILQQITGLNTFFAGPSASRDNGVVLLDTATVTWNTDGQGNIQATASGSSLPTATAAGQVPTSTGAGNAYTAQAPSSGLTLIQQQTASGSVTFSSIPQTYTNLKLVMNSTSSSSGSPVFINITFNGDSGYNYVTSQILNINGTVSSTAGVGAFNLVVGVSGGQGNYGATEVTIPGYSTANQKSAIGSGIGLDGSNGYVFTGGGVWQTAAITSVTVTASFTGGTISLYGMA